jgi:hypothetical protein
MVLLPSVFYPKDCIANALHLFSVTVALKIGAELLHAVDSAVCHIFYVIVKCTEQLYSHLLLTLLCETHHLKNCRTLCISDNCVLLLDLCEYFCISVIMSRFSVS